MPDLMKDRGLLLVMIDVEPAYEAEFHRWYNEEHLPERLRCPGFLSGRRFVLEDRMSRTHPSAHPVRPGAGVPQGTVQGSPKYLALYDLQSPEVLDSEDYQRLVVPPSEWTQRISPHFTQQIRNVYREITP